MNRKERVELALKAIVGQGKSDIDSSNYSIGEILTPNFMNKTPYEECLIVNLPAGTDAAKVNYTNDGFLGGIQATWIDEGDEIPVDKGSFATKNIPLGKLSVVIPLTNEITEDIPSLTQYISKMITRAIRYEVNKAIIYDGGAVDGIMASSNQATHFVDMGVFSTIKAQVNQMYKKYYGSDEGVWLFSKDKYIELVDDYDSDLAFSAENPFGQLWGLPIHVVPYLASGQMILADFSHYVLAQKEMRQSVSESLYFDTDQSALKTVLRIGGKVPFDNGWTNEDNYIVYPFVAVDAMLPIITISGANPQTIEYGDLYVELGATAFDNVDGDITADIVTDATDVDVNILGSYAVTYNVTDSQGNSAVEASRTVNVVDTEAPVITLVGANPQSVTLSGSYTELGATALDNYDGDITVDIVIDATEVDVDTLGAYTVYYNVDDSSGNSAITVERVVNVVE